MSTPIPGTAAEAAADGVSGAPAAGPAASLPGGAAPNGQDPPAETQGKAEGDDAAKGTDAPAGADPDATAAAQPADATDGTPVVNLPAAAAAGSGGGAPGTILSPEVVTPEQEEILASSGLPMSWDAEWDDEDELSWAIGGDLEFAEEGEVVDEWDGPVGDGLDEEEGIGGIAVSRDPAADKAAIDAAARGGRRLEDE